jgi:TRAP-type C4-dicarboxylate transport system permease large subunit
LVISILAGVKTPKNLAPIVVALFTALFTDLAVRLKLKTLSEQNPQSTTTDAPSMLIRQPKYIFTAVIGVSLLAPLLIFGFVYSTDNRVLFLVLITFLVVVFAIFLFERSQKQA